MNMSIRRFGRRLRYGRGSSPGAFFSYPPPRHALGWIPPTGFGPSLRGGLMPNMPPYRYPPHPYTQPTRFFPTSSLAPHPTYYTRQRLAPRPQQQTVQPTLTPIHENCAYFTNLGCTLRGVPVPAGEVACPNFTPRIRSPFEGKERISDAY